jgi:excisionase family DNA binding protein
MYFVSGVLRPRFVGAQSKELRPSAATMRRSLCVVRRCAMGTLEPIALSPRDTAQFLSISKRTMSRLIARREIVARKDGVRTLVDMASLKAYYEAHQVGTFYRFAALSNRIRQNGIQVK